MRTHLASLVEDFRRHAGETAIVAHRGNRRYRTSYGQLAQLAGRFAAELDRREISPGERVVLWGANSAEWMAAFFGCLLRGVIAVPLDAAGSAEFAARVVADVAPRLLAGDPGLLRGLAGDLPRLRLSELGATLPAEANFAVSESVGPLTPFQIVFTSGTTSEPKGIVHTHANVLASVRPIEREMAKYRRVERVVHPLRFLHTLPLSHVFGQFMALWLPPLLAGEVHFAEQLEARRMTELLRRERISVLVAVPRVLELLRAHLLGRFPTLAEELEATRAESKWKKWWIFRRIRRALGWKFWAIISGGAALPPELEDFWHGLAIPIIQGYGLTETSALVSLNNPFKIAQGTIGKTLPGREVRLGEDGEILVRGDILATSTWSGGQMRPRESEWLATGDLGERNERGDLRYLGRKGDMIVTAGGMNIHPGDLEAAMKSQPGIRDCAVVSWETPAGPEPVAVALAAVGEAELQQAVVAANRGLAEFQQIRRALLWPEPQFPYTSTGKLQRRKVRDWVKQVAEEQRHPGLSSGGRPGRSGGDSLLAMISEITGERVAEAGGQLRLGEDLHLDSLGRVQLQTAIEQRLDRELPDDALAAIETLGELRALLAWEVAPEARNPASAAAQTGEIRAEDASQAGQAPPQADSKDAYPPDTSREPRLSAPAGGDLKELTSGHLYPRWPWSWPVAALRAAFLELGMRPLVWLLGAPRVVGPKQELPPGPLLVIANHVTAYDGALVLYALPGKLRRSTAIAMVGEMLLDFRRGRNQANALQNLLAPLQYWLVTALFNVFPMPRQHGFRKSFQHAGEAMDRCYSVLVFPEGARHADGALRPFRQGIGLLAEESRIPILPVALVGLGEVAREGQTRRAAWFRSGRLEVRVGEAIPVDEAMEPAELTAKLEGAVRELMA